MANGEGIPTWHPMSDRRTVADVVRDGAVKWGDRPAMIVHDETVTYAQADRRSNAVARTLRRHDVRTGDRVAMLLENCIEIIDVWFGCAKLGAIEVAINTANRGEYLRHQLTNCDPSVLILDSQYLDRMPAGVTLPSLRAVYIQSSGGDIALPAELLGVPCYSVRALRDEDESDPEVDEPPGPSDPLSIVYTGGTTGPSKGVVLSHHYTVHAADMTARGRELGDDDVVYSPLPLYHFNAQIMTILGPMLYGGHGVLDQHFSASNLWERVDHFGATQVVILGAQITMVWNLPPDRRDDQHGVRVVIGAPISHEMKQAWQRRYGVRLSGGFGQTECVPIATSPVSVDVPPGSSGKVAPSVDVRIFDDEDAELPCGEVGEICVRPREPSVMFSGYFRDPEATSRVWRNGWYHTGDLGKIDADGWFWFVDRKKDYLRRRGENVSSFEVETVVGSYPAVAEVACVGVSSSFTEDDCLVAVVPHAGCTIDPWDLMTHCIDNMPFFAVPRYIRVVDELPKSPLGKTLKYQLREEGVPQGTFDLEAEGYRVNRTGLVPLSATTAPPPRQPHQQHPPQGPTAAPT